MTKIIYRWCGGSEVAYWPGESYRDGDGRPRKKGQIYIGKVINKEEGIFWTRQHKFCGFDTKTLTHTTLDPELIPIGYEDIDKCKHINISIVDFGDSYFLHQFLNGIGYFNVLNSIKYGNRDRLYAILQYYILSPRSNFYADTWLKGSFCQFLYPRANLNTQRCSEALAVIGSEENYRSFIKNHISYILEFVNGELRVSLDTTGLPNSCGIHITRLSCHFGETNIEFRLLIVIELSTGLPIYFDIFEGNVLDKSITESIISDLKQFNCEVKYILTDAGFLYPELMKKLALRGIKFMTRLNENFDLHTNALKEHSKELEDPSNHVRYKNRIIGIVEIETYFIDDNDKNKKVHAYIYLCKDFDQYYSKSKALIGSKESQKLTQYEIHELILKFGIFSFISIEKLTKDQVMSTYYIRQGTEQCLDYAKNYVKMLPVHQHSVDSVRGHMIFSFIGTFIIMLMKSKMKNMDCTYVVVPNSICNEENLYNDEIYEVENIGTIIEQKPIKYILERSTTSLFEELKGQKARVYTSVIRPSYPTRQALDYYETFNISSPNHIVKQGDKLKYIYDGAPAVLTKEIAFSRRPDITDEEILANRKLKSKQSSKDDSLNKLKTKGKSKGSKNILTLQREEFIESEGIELNSKEARNLVKKLIVIERKVQSAGYNPYSKKGKELLIKLLNTPSTEENQVDHDSSSSRGRPRGSKNEISVQREEFIKSCEVDPNSIKGKRLIIKLRVLEKCLKSENISPYSSEGIERLKELIDKDLKTEHLTKGRPEGSRTETVLNRENIIKSTGIDPNSREGQRLVRKLRSAEKHLSNNEIDPYSQEGIDYLKNVINDNIDQKTNDE